MNPLRRHIAYIVGRWRESARQAALYRVHLEVTEWMVLRVNDMPLWILYEAPWTQEWTEDPLGEASPISLGWTAAASVIYVSGRSPFQGGVHGLAFHEYGIAIVDSLNPGTICHVLAHLMGRDHSAKGKGDIMDDLWPYRDWPNIPYEVK